MSSTQSHIHPYTWFVALPLLLLILSHLAWYAFLAIPEACPPQDMRNCGLASGLALIMAILSIPSNVLWFLTKNLLGLESYTGNLTFLIFALVGWLIFACRKPLFETGITAVSYTVSPANKQEPQPSTRDIKSTTEHAKRETERKDAQTEMEDAIREMEEAKARLDALKKDQS